MAQAPVADRGTVWTDSASQRETSWEEHLGLLWLLVHIVIVVAATELRLVEYRFGLAPFFADDNEQIFGELASAVELALLGPAVRNVGGPLIRGKRTDAHQADVHRLIVLATGLSFDKARVVTANLYSSASLLLDVLDEEALCARQRHRSQVS